MTHRASDPAGPATSPVATPPVATTGPATPRVATPAPPGVDLPDPSTRPCADCGHVWFDGERRHEYVTGPPPPGFRTGGVEVVCVLCSRQRSRPALDD